MNIFLNIDRNSCFNPTFFLQLIFLLEIESNLPSLKHSCPSSLVFEDRKSTEWPMLGDLLDVNTIRNDLAFFLKFVEFALIVFGESKLLASIDLLSAWELHLGSSE